MNPQHCLKDIFIPELGTPYKGKVRDIYEKDSTLTLITTDRISVFDKILNEPVKDKGRILTNLSLFWFDNTKDIIPNHVIQHPDQNVIIVKKCKPILVEIIVRGYMVGSLWRDYSKGSRIKCGVALPHGLNKNDPLPYPIITPTTKSSDGHDQDVTKEELIKNGTITANQWAQIEKLSLKLFERGREILNEKGIILLDTKYEFGLDDLNNIILIDEIHTPDSSRFWFQKELEQKELRYPDKEFAREWAMSQGFMGDGPVPKVPDEIREKIREGYKEIYETITGEKLTEINCDPSSRLVCNLKRKNLIKGLFSLIITDQNEEKNTKIIEQVLKVHSIPYKTLNLSECKSREQRREIISKYNESIEPIVCILSIKNTQILSDFISAKIQWPTIVLSSDHPIDIPYPSIENPTNAAFEAIKILKTMEKSS